MTNKDIFKIWAPIGAKWVDWVRPVPFIYINDNLKTYEFYEFKIPEVNYITEYAKDAAIILDLPSYESINEGIALAKLGFRPIPIYNGTNEQEGTMSVVKNETIEFALIWGALELNKIEISKDASPVFLLDSNRTISVTKNSSVFDNSWDIYDQDIPSAEYFLKNGIKKIIVRSSVIQRDLRSILYKFQKKGIEILFTDGFEIPKMAKIKQSLFKRKYIIE